MNNLQDTTSQRREEEHRVTALIELQRAIKELEALKATSPFQTLYTVAIATINVVLEQLEKKEL